MAKLTLVTEEDEDCVHMLLSVVITGPVEALKEALELAIEEEKRESSNCKFSYTLEE